MYTLNALADERHVFAEQEQLVSKAIELLESDEATIRESLEKMLMAGDLILDQGAIYLPPFFYAEMGTAHKLCALYDAPASIEIMGEVNIDVIQKQTGMQYDEVQADAIKTALSSKIMILTGGPGTGKTTTTKGIIAAMRACCMDIKLAAPTGRAAKRMTEATGLEAKTIHRLLEFKPSDGYKHNEQKPDLYRYYSCQENDRSCWYEESIILRRQQCNSHEEEYAAM